MRDSYLCDTPNLAHVAIYFEEFGEPMTLRIWRSTGPEVSEYCSPCRKHTLFIHEEKQKDGSVHS